MGIRDCLDLVDVPANNGDARKHMVEPGKAVIVHSTDTPRLPMEI